MSKKEKNRKKERQLVDQDLTPKEKKIIGIIGAVALLLIVVVCVVTVISNQDKNVIKNAYGLDKHIYTYTTLQEVESMKEKGDEFHLLIVKKPSSTESKTALFVKAVNEKFSEEKIQNVYLLEIDSIVRIEDRRVLANVLGLTYETLFGGSSSSSRIPTIAYIVNNDVVEQYSLVDYPNASDLIQDYFNNYKN